MSQHIHFMGIGGSGASAAAQIAKSQGYQISGCDQNPFNEFTRSFDQSILSKGHSPSHLTSGNTDLLVLSPAITSLDPENSELLEAKKQHIPILTWQEFMGRYLEKDKFVIAISGTHGKSTTTAMIGKLLEDNGLDPTVELGAIIPEWGTNYRIGKSKYFVTEADEFNDNFLNTHPDIAVVTTIEMDHPEYFKDFNAYKDSFAKFISQTKQTIIINSSDRGVQDILATKGETSSSLSPEGSSLRVEDLEAKAIDYSQNLIDFQLQVPGEYNKLNASAAFQVGLALGIDPEIIKKSLMSYQGVGRRFEYIGDYQEAKVYSDFGHHPTAIKVTLEAAREKFPKQRIITIFQPHMFSRTLALKDDFIQVLKNLPVDKTIIMDIYPSREVDTGLISSADLVKAVDKDNVLYLPNTMELFTKLQKEANADTILFFIGAGDTDKWAKELVHKESI